jgi:endonuclease YncB( thermonuclease family)
MIKLFLTALLVMLFALGSIAQSNMEPITTVEKAPTAKASQQTRVVSVAKKQTLEVEVYSVEQMAILDNLKAEDEVKYREYLSDKKDIATLKNHLVTKSLNPTEKEAMESKIRSIESGLKTKFGL